MATYRLTIQKIEEFQVDVEADSIIEAHKVVDRQVGPQRHARVLGSTKHAYRVVGKHLYVENGIARKK